MTSPIFTDNSAFKVGAVQYPLTGSTANTLLQDADPVLYNLLRFYSASIDLDLGARWDAEVTNASLPDLARKIISDFVSYDPIHYLTQDNFRFPLLVAYRGSSNFYERTTTWYTEQTNLNVLWIMPPLDSAQANRLLPFLNSVKQVLVSRTEDGLHTLYLNGEPIWKDCNLESIGVETCEPGNLPGAGDSFFPTVMLKVLLKERRQKPNNLFGVLTGVDTQVTSSTVDPVSGTLYYTVAELSQSF